MKGYLPHKEEEKNKKDEIKIFYRVVNISFNALDSKPDYTASSINNKYLRYSC